MRGSRLLKTGIALASLLLVAAVPAWAAHVDPQCPANITDTVTGQTEDPNVQCKHLSAGDGFVTMADGRPLYMFGFADMTGVPDDAVMDAGMLAQGFPGPTLVADEGKDFYLSLTNVGMVVRPDLFDPHTVHWHGFPNASAIFDGVPDASISINMGGTLTYYYKVPGPGTYMYHCHVEATEHMQMGMLANLYVRPLQDGTSIEYPPASGKSYTKFAYNDGDGSTGYDVDYPIQIGSFDPEFHDASETVQPLPFAMMKDRYAMLNGRGYPDTVNPGPLGPVDHEVARPDVESQQVSSLITATVGQKILLRISNLNITRFNTLATLGIPMQVVGIDARQLKSTDGVNLYYMTNSVTLGGGMAVDVILDTTGILPGTYFLYTTNLEFLTNNGEDFGGQMTEIRIAGL